MTVPRSFVADVIIRTGRYSTPIGEFIVTDCGDYSELRFVKGRFDVVLRFRNNGVFYNYQVGMSDITVTPENSSNFVARCQHLLDSYEGPVFNVQSHCFIPSYVCSGCYDVLKGDGDVSLVIEPAAGFVHKDRAKQ